MTVAQTRLWPCEASAMAPPRVGADAGAPDRTEKEAGDQLARHPAALRRDAGIGPCGKSGGRGREAGLQARDQKDRAEADHDHGPGLRDDLFVETQCGSEGGDEDAEGDEGYRHAQCQHQRPRPPGLQCRGQHDRQHRQDAGVDQCQEAGEEGEDRFHRLEPTGPAGGVSSPWRQPAVPAVPVAPRESPVS